MISNQTKFWEALSNAQCQKLTDLVDKAGKRSVRSSSAITNSADVSSPSTQQANDPVRLASITEPNAPDAAKRLPEPACPIVDSVTGDRTIEREKVIVSYSHKGKKFLDQLLAHLKPLVRAGRVDAGSDWDIEPGSQWFNQIKSAVASARVAVLLVTKDFLASDFIHEYELGPLLEDADTGDVRFLWVLVRDCNWKATPLQRLQAAYPTDRPLTQMKAERDTAWVAICVAIESAANKV